ncbi:LTA synthase family protein [Gramella jeungdoensis]|uniref:LTA synthase family protein n=1 Tax=Gramella jeungdoensis TaxID=708091 RepID=A0ABT0YZP9_9FLAO|nr:LTA synthase family protein [Gramella jeungdoensis]MCM8568377.1 LTA synthase family protein [Gramella jeungdoensis]
MRSEKSKLLRRLKNSSCLFASLSLIYLGFLFLSDLVEIGLGMLNHSVNQSFISLLGWSFLEDLKFYLFWLLPAYLIFLPFHFLLPRVAKGFFITAFIIFFVIQFLLIFYFNTTLLMLGSDLFGYSIQEIIQTVGASDSLSLAQVLIFIIVISAMIYSLLVIPKKSNLNWQYSIMLPVLSLLFLIFGSGFSADTSNLSSEFENNLVRNKSAHFYGDAYAYFNPEVYEIDIYAESYLRDLSNGYAGLEYIDETNYPFFHKQVDQDVLSPFFETKEKAPNIVIILVEGLGRAFTNKGAYLGNFTPFLDSLSNQSLYWPNFLSNGGRTFAVLPSLLGSLPFAENGFMEMEGDMPTQLSLLNLLKNNGYETSFYYGGNSEFDQMGGYLRKNNIDHIIDEDDFPESYQKIPAALSGFTWGYADKELYGNFLRNKELETSDSPKLDVLLTISTHDPFLTDEPEKYDRLFEERMEQLEFHEEKKRDYRKYQKQYTSILYADDALQDLISSYKERTDFENTVFIITGDHRIPEIPMASKIDRYHVPLIIYSPLLKRSAEFRSISSHFDIAPSLISFLKNNYQIKAPEVNAFLGQGLDTIRRFQNEHYIPLKQTKTELRDFVMGEYHLNGDDLYKLGPNMEEELVTDMSEKEELQYAFEQFKRKNAEFIKAKKIIPDSITSKYLSQ